MTHLLDTHALLWAVGDPDRLGARARAVLEDSSQRLCVSAVSAWEISTKRRLGKLPGAAAVTANYSRVLRRLAVTSIPITDDHALLEGSLDWSHRDPFDRMLAAVALTEGLTLVTADGVFESLAGIRSLW